LPKSRGFSIQTFPLQGRPSEPPAPLLRKCSQSCIETNCFSGSTSASQGSPRVVPLRMTLLVMVFAPVARCDLFFPPALYFASTPLPTVSVIPHTGFFGWSWIVFGLYLPLPSPFLRPPRTPPHRSNVQLACSETALTVSSKPPFPHGLPSQTLFSTHPSEFVSLSFLLLRESLPRGVHICLTHKPGLFVFVQFSCRELTFSPLKPLVKPCPSR